MDGKRLNSSMYTLFLFGILVSNSISDYRRKPKGRREVGWFHVMAEPFHGFPWKITLFPGAREEDVQKYRDEYNPRATSLKFIALHWDNDSWIRVYTSVLSHCIYSLLAVYLKLVDSVSLFPSEEAIDIETGVKIPTICMQLSPFNRSNIQQNLHESIINTKKRSFNEILITFYVFRCIRIF